MIRQLLDPANAITAAGVLLSMSGIYFAMSGRPELGVAIVLWALLADHLDGAVAARTPRRAKETASVGKNLDSLADLISAGAFPAVLLIEISGATIASLAVASALVLASVLRLSYFNVHGLDGTRFIGVPTTYVLPAIAILFLLKPLLPAGQFAAVLSATLMALAVLHVTPLRVPKTSGAMYAVVTLFVVSTSGVFLLRAVP